MSRETTEFAIPWESLTDSNRRNILDYLFSNNKTSVQKISKDLEIAVANVSQHLKKLEASKIVEFRKNGTQHCYRLTKFGHEIIKKVYQIETELKKDFKFLGDN